MFVALFEFNAILPSFVKKTLDQNHDVFTKKKFVKFSMKSYHFRLACVIQTSSFKCFCFLLSWADLFLTFVRKSLILKIAIEIFGCLIGIFEFLQIFLIAAFGECQIFKLWTSDCQLFL